MFHYNSSQTPTTCCDSVLTKCINAGCSWGSLARQQAAEESRRYGAGPLCFILCIQTKCPDMWLVTRAGDGQCSFIHWSHPPRNYCMNQMVPELTKNNHVGHACSLLLLQHPAFLHQKTDESRCQNCLSETSSKFKAPKNPLCGKLMNLGLHWGWW